MKPEIPNENDERLSQLLGTWKVQTPLPPHFSEQVWRRAEREEAPAVNPLEYLRAWVARATLRPAFAFSCATALLLAGVLAGFWQGNAASQRASETLSVRYVRAVDPYRMPRH